jgi:uncharacterized protein (TIGR00369 family)
MSSTDEDAARRQRRFVQGFVGGVPHLKALGVTYRGHGDDWLELELPWSPTLIADPDHGVLASGPIFALMDSAVGMASFLKRRALEPNATLDLRIDYLRAPKPQTAVIGRGECYRMTKQIAFVRGVAHDGDLADPIAHVAGTFMFTPVTPDMAAAWMARRQQREGGPA